MQQMKSLDSVPTRRRLLSFMNRYRDNNLMLFGLGVHEHSWRGLKYLLGLYLGSLLFAAIVTVPVFSFFNWLADTTQSEFLLYLVDRNIDDFFDRLRWLPILIGLPWLLVRCGLFSFRNLGLVWNEVHRKLYRNWFLIGAVVLAVVMIGQLFFVDISLKEKTQGARWLTVPLLATLTGVAVAFIEEIVFRGLVLRIFYTAFRPVLGIGLSAAFFAYTHFKVPDVAASALENSDQWWMGFYVAYWMLVGIAFDFSFIGFLNLFVFGLLLSLLFIRTRSLMACMGFHAGVVWLRITYIRLVHIESGDERWLWGSGKMIDGLLPLIILVGICFWFLWKQRQEGNRIITS